jgi:hypothetical protein
MTGDGKVLRQLRRAVARNGAYPLPVFGPCRWRPIVVFSLFA